MSANKDITLENAIGHGITTIDIPPNAVFRVYRADRPAPSARLHTTEHVIDVSITLAYPVKLVWPILKDFNLWMNRFGFYWDGVPADNEGKIVSLSNKAGANDFDYGVDKPTQYVVRRVIPEHLIYNEALVTPMPSIDGAWSGHSVVSLREERQQTKITNFMEHTLYSETMSVERLNAEVTEGLPSIIAFWRDYFVPDLNAAVESRLGGAKT